MANVPEVSLIEYRMLRSIAVQYEALEQLHNSIGETLTADTSRRVAQQYRERMQNLRDGK